MLGVICVGISMVVGIFVGVRLGVRWGWLRWLKGLVLVGLVVVGRG